MNSLCVENCIAVLTLLELSASVFIAWFVYEEFNGSKNMVKETANMVTEIKNMVTSQNSVVDALRTQIREAGRPTLIQNGSSRNLTRQHQSGMPSTLGTSYDLIFRNDGARVLVHSIEWDQVYSPFPNAPLLLATNSDLITGTNFELSFTLPQGAPTNFRIIVITRSPASEFYKHEISVEHTVSPIFAKLFNYLPRFTV